MNRNEQIKAVGMLSGGLDSILAVRVVLEQGIEVTALHFRTGFSYVERDRVVGQDTGPSGAERAAAMLGVNLEIVDVSAKYLPLVLNPRYGYGSGMNPCVDCRIFLLRQAKGWMEEHGYHFVFTGEVVGQRPKSQMRPTLKTVERESGLRGYLLRPLSARLLDPTVPEQRGWVDREKLYGIGGRGRKEQIALAERFGIGDYPQPSGGCCYLIDQTYSRRLRDLLAREGNEALTPGRVQLLAVGRHLRLPSGRKIVVGRREQENDYLATCGIEGVLLATPEHPGPTTLMPGTPTREEIELAARITAGYSDGKDEPAVPVEVVERGGPMETL
ncbi:MAG: hypothetical protein KKC18_16365, partial [Chloroflexi bacterium]|nr:hypothetical protein [Chloroflexota bacterium]